MNEAKPKIEVFPVDSPPGLASYGDMIETTYIKGNMGGLAVIKLRTGELPEHSHEQEHVGVVLEGSFEFVNGDEVSLLRAGEMYRIPPNVPHGVRCQDYTLIIQAGA